MRSGELTILVLDVQVPHIARIADHVKPTDRFSPIALHDDHVVSSADSRALLDGIGLSGQLVHTPSHSPDSVTLLLDTGAVFTGDLTPPAFIPEAEAEETLASWRTLRELGATTMYAGHGPIRPTWASIGA